MSQVFPSDENMTFLKWQAVIFTFPQLEKTSAGTGQPLTTH